MLLQQRAASAAACSARSRQGVAAVSTGSRTAVCAPVRPSAGQRLAVQRQAAAADAPAAEAAAPKAAPKPTLHNQPAPQTYAIVEVAGKQMFVEQGKWYVTNRLKGVEVGDTIRLGRVLAFKQAGAFQVGKPYLEGVQVEAQILEEFRGPKVIVYKMKPKKHYRRKNGHRQELTKFMVTKVGA